MCGIAGIVSKSKFDEQEVLNRMVKALLHRGPDDEGIAMVGEGVGFGHTRLSIIDLASGKQPMCSHDGRFWITYNGEIYNYRELRESLLRRGCSFRTHSDTEVILEAYRSYGPRCLNELDGMYAFAIWDSRERLLFAARDPFGKKPFYYTNGEKQTWLFASEIKALFASGIVQGVVDYGALNDYLKLLYVPPYRTIYRNIFTLPPGHYLNWQRDRLSVQEYWSPEFENCEGCHIEEQDVVDKLRELLTDAVKKRILASDVPVGAFLSGGLDSSTIVALMSQLSNRPVKTFSVGFGKLINELPYAKAVAERYGTEHNEINMDINVADLLLTMASIYDEPFPDSSNIPTYLISEFSRQEVKVVLTGDGGDELFGGYTWWYQPLLASKAVDVSPRAELRRMLKLRLARNLKNLRGMPDRFRDFHERIYRQLQRQAQAVKLAREFSDLWHRHLAQATYFNGEEQEDLWKRKDGQVPFNFEQLRPVEWDGINQAFYFDARLFLPGDILVKVDRASMANSLETRAPLLDRRLADFAFSLPNTLKFRNGVSKYIFRKAFSHLLPKSSLRQPKQGFGAPVEHWLRDPKVRELCDDLTNGNDTSIWNVLQRNAALQYVNRFYDQGVRSEAYRVWGLLCLLLWERQWRQYQRWT